MLPKTPALDLLEQYALILDNPKSQSFRRRLVNNSTFADLRSRCRMPFWCKNDMPLAMSCWCKKDMPLAMS